jgi:hypothetical protein
MTLALILILAVWIVAVCIEDRRANGPDDGPRVW